MSGIALPIKPDYSSQHYPTDVFRTTPSQPLQARRAQGVRHVNSHIIPPRAIHDRNVSGRDRERQAMLRTIDSRTLFHGATEIVIEHQGAQYRLRVTRQGKLILNK
jgi:hemin uptake protein HemP